MRTMGGYIGELRLFAGPCPQGWLPCEGQTLVTSQHRILRHRMTATPEETVTTVGPDSKRTTTYTGPATFQLPDLRGRVALGTGDGFARLSTGGEEAHTLTEAEMPAHWHSILHSSHAATANAAVVAASLGVAGVQMFASQGAGGKVIEPMAAKSLATAGGGAPHLNLQPYLGLRWCICVVAGDLDAFAGEVRAFVVRDAVEKGPASSGLPDGWVACDGRVIDRHDNPIITQLLGTTFGLDPDAGIVLPDLRARVPLGNGVGAIGPVLVGQAGGERSAALTSRHLPAHTHQFYASSGVLPSPTGNLFGKGQLYMRMAPDMAFPPPTGVSGSGQSATHNNMQPYAVVVYAICVNETAWPLSSVSEGEH